MNSDASPCRLSILLARDAPVAAVLRRGPSAWVRLSLWRTDSDIIEHGQWFRGRVYERRCDLSPDGRLFAYFARKDSPRIPDDVGAESWIAVSRPPWFTALALWAIGSTWCAGAYFVDQRTLFAAHTTEPPDLGTLPAWLTLTRDPPFVDRTNDWTDSTVHFNRLLRGGWSPVSDVSAPNPWWERRSPDGASTLLMMPRHDAWFTDYGGRHTTEYALRDERDGSVRELGTATWADWDHRGRLTLARQGRLLAWRAPGALDEIADFNAQVPAPEPSPPDAKLWPDVPSPAALSRERNDNSPKS
jgi:hypothetical protein